MDTFVMVDLQDLFYMPDIEEGAGRDISGGRDCRDPFGGSDKRQAVERREGRVCLRRIAFGCKTAGAVRPLRCKTVLRTVRF